MPKTRINALEIHYEIRGKGKPFIIIQGLVRKEAWNCQAKHLEQNHKVIILDMKKTKGHNFRFLAQVLHAFVEKFKLEKPILCGDSFGSEIVKSYAALYPEDLKKLIIANPVPLRNPRLRIVRFLVRPCIPLLIMLVQKNIFPWWTRWAHDAVNHEIKSQSPSQFKFKLIEKMPLRDIVCSIMLSRYVQLRLIKVPTFIIVGSENKNAVAYAKNLKKQLRNAKTRVVEIPNAFHSCHAENPKCFRKVIGGWIKK